MVRGTEVGGFYREVREVTVRRADWEISSRLLWGVDSPRISPKPSRVGWGSPTWRINIPSLLVRSIWQSRWVAYRAGRRKVLPLDHNWRRVWRLDRTSDWHVLKRDRCAEGVWCLGKATFHDRRNDRAFFDSQLSNPSRCVRESGRLFCGGGHSSLPFWWEWDDR